MLYTNKLVHRVVLRKILVGHVRFLRIDFSHFKLFQNVYASFSHLKFAFVRFLEFRVKSVLRINMNSPIDNILVFRKIRLISRRLQNSDSDILVFSR